MSQVGHTTIDFRAIGERAQDFGVALDGKALKALNEIRNDMEHHYTSEPSTAIRAAISKGFPVAASLFRQMEEDPIALLGEAWTTMLDTKELYDQELREARATLAKIRWYSPSISPEFVKCTACQSELVEQIDGENDTQAIAELRCKTCGSDVEMVDVIEQVLEAVYGAEAYLRHKDVSEPGPIYDCRACGHSTLVESENGCGYCNEPLDYVRECRRCEAGISVQDYYEGLDEGLCSYCSHIWYKMMKED